MNERTAESATTVEEDGINVEKSFTDDEFPVPAITYDLSSDRKEPARVRIVDTIPESFPMDRVGFHPEYESDNWTAYKDHRVEFERVLDPGESVRTVFGIRSDDPDIDGFLGAPVIEHVPVGEEIEDVLGTDDTDAVREVLSGDRATLPGMEEDERPADEPPADTDPAGEPEEPEATDASDSDSESEVDDDTPPRRSDVETESAVTRHDDADPVRDDSGPETDFGSETDSDTPENDPDPGTDAMAGSTIASALADEIRADEVADDDLELLRSEIDVGVPRSVDVRISRLQSSVADIEAYADALAEFIDEEGTGRELLENLRSRVDEIESDVTTLDDRVDSADAERTGLATDVEDAEESIVEVEETTARIEQSVSAVETDVDEVAADLTAVDESVESVRDDVRTVESEVTGIDEAVDDLGDDVETLYEELDSTASALANTDERVEDVESRLGRLDAEFDDVWEDLAEVDGRLTSVEDSLGDDVDDIESELDSIHDHLEELEAFRKRLNEAFGP